MNACLPELQHLPVAVQPLISGRRRTGYQQTLDTLWRASLSVRVVIDVPAR